MWALRDHVFKLHALRTDYINSDINGQIDWTWYLQFLDENYIYWLIMLQATWRKVKATGDIPNKGSGMCMASNRHFIYAFGGLTLNQANMYVYLVK